MSHPSPPIWDACSAQQSVNTAWQGRTGLLQPPGTLAGSDLTSPGCAAAAVRRAGARRHVNQLSPSDQCCGSRPGGYSEGPVGTSTSTKCTENRQSELFA